MTSKEFIREYFPTAKWVVKVDTNESGNIVNNVIQYSVSSSNGNTFDWDLSPGSPISYSEEEAWDLCAREYRTIDKFLTFQNLRSKKFFLDMREVTPMIEPKEEVNVAVVSAVTPIPVSEDKSSRNPYGDVSESNW